MESAFEMERTLNRNGSLLLYFWAISVLIRDWLSVMRSSNERPVSRSLDGSDECVPIHSFVLLDESSRET